jgi:hypothetical protein
MSDHSVMIELPEHISQRLSLLAETTARPLAETVAQSVVSNLPPEIDKSSPELLRMQSLQDTDLLEIAQAVVDSEQQSYHEELLAKNALDELSNDERAELIRL